MRSRCVCVDGLSLFYNVKPEWQTNKRNDKAQTRRQKKNKNKNKIQRKEE